MSSVRDVTMPSPFGLNSFRDSTRYYPPDMSAPRGEPESLYACLRLAAALALMTIGGAGMYAMAVALPLIQQEFAAARSAATVPYTLTMLGFGFGGILMGRLSDRHGVMLAVLAG